MCTGEKDDDEDEPALIDPLCPLTTDDWGVTFVLPVNDHGITTMHDYDHLTSENGWKTKHVQGLFRSFVTHYYRKQTSPLLR
jgi:hypothetical protein